MCKNVPVCKLKTDAQEESRERELAETRRNDDPDVQVLCSDAMLKDICMAIPCVECVLRERKGHPPRRKMGFGILALCMAISTHFLLRDGLPTDPLSVRNLGKTSKRYKTTAGKKGNVKYGASW